MRKDRKGGGRMQASGHTFADSLHGADLGPVFHSVDGEVDLGKRLLLLDGADGIVDLLGAAILVGGERRDVLGVHVESLCRRGFRDT